MKIIYNNGPHPSVEVAGVGVFKRGEPTEVPDDIAMKLLENPLWKRGRVFVKAEEA